MHSDVHYICCKKNIKGILFLWRTRGRFRNPGDRTDQCTRQHRRPALHPLWTTGPDGCPLLQFLWPPLRGGCALQEETAFAKTGGDTPGLEPLRLRHAIAYYLVALGVTVLVFMTLPGFTFIVYLCCGFVMTRVVMRRLVEWHPVYNTLQTVTSAKLGINKAF